MQDTVLADRYRLVDWLGGGSMGDVWLAEDEILGRRVAVKVVKPALLDESGFAERFHAEARVMAQLRHPGIVGVYDYGHSAADGRSSVGYLVMELIDGEPLSAVLERRGTLPVAEALRMALQVLEALETAHRSGVVHRDIKPANLMVRGDQAGAGRTVIADFGIARPGCDARLTVPGMVLGTAAYQAPEQASSGTVTASADLYALGVVLYECLAGGLPFDGETALEVILKHLTEPVPPLPEGVPAPVGALIRRAMAKEPGERWPDAATMAAAVRAALAPGAEGLGVEGLGAELAGAEGLGVSLASTAPDRPRTPARHARRAGARVRALVGVTALTLLCVGGAAGATVIRPDRDGVTDAAAVARPSADLAAPPITASVAADRPLAGQPSAPATPPVPTAGPGTGESPAPSPEPAPTTAVPERPGASPQAPAVPLPPPAGWSATAPAPAPTSAPTAQPTHRDQPSPTATATATQPAPPTQQPKPELPAQAQITSNGAALDNYYSKNEDGNGINTYIANGSSAQTWRLEKVSEANYYLRNGSTGFEKVLDLDVKTGKVQVWSSPPPSANQIWSIVPAVGGYQIVNYVTKECLTSSGVGFWASVSTCASNRPGQVWTFS
ncbi:serine/threonine protein kinase [Kitasatospora sp. NPDC094028]